MRKINDQNPTLAYTTDGAEKAFGSAKEMALDLQKAYKVGGFHITRQVEDTLVVREAGDVYVYSGPEQGNWDALILHLKKNKA